MNLSNLNRNLWRILRSTRRFTLANLKTPRTRINSQIRLIATKTSLDIPNEKLQALSVAELEDSNKFDNLTEDNVLQLFQTYCSGGIYNKSLHEKSETLKKLFDNYNGIITAQLVNSFLQGCIENRALVNVKDVLGRMAEAPTKDTFELILQYVAEHGDVATCLMILSMMKERNVTVDERTFNSLVMAHIINGGVEAGNSVLQTMKLAQISETFNTRWAVVKAATKCQNRGDFAVALDKCPRVEFDPDLFFDLLLRLGLNDKHTWLLEFSAFWGIETIPRQYLKLLEQTCVQLVHENKPNIASEFYTKLYDKNSIQADFGKTILDEMVVCNIPVEIIIKNAELFQDANASILFDVTETSLRLRQPVQTTLALFKALPYLRTHFFWPLLIHAGQERSEAGVIDILHLMASFRLKPDFETFKYYFLKYCDMSDTTRLVRTLTAVENVKVKDLSTPLLAYMLSRNWIDEAKEFCLKTEGVLKAEDILKPLSMAWKNTTKSKEIVDILQKLCETNPVETDWCGLFIQNVMVPCKNHLSMVELLQEIRNRKLKISSESVHNINNSIRLNNYFIKTKKTEIEQAVDNLMDISKSETQLIKHPRNMNVNELECHLVELTNKNMETRGVLRKLLQEHCRLENSERVEALRVLLQEGNYPESGGMKCSIFVAYVKCGKLKEAEDVYSDLKKSMPNFSIDSFKVIDFAGLLIANGLYQRALDVLINESKSVRSDVSEIQKNCVRLLNSVESYEETSQLFNLLTKYGYCKKNNVTLGTLIRAHLKENNIVKALELYEDCAKKHRCTPLQVELLGRLAADENGEMLTRAIQAAASVHGALKAQMGLVVALCETEKPKALFKLLSSMKLVPKDVLVSSLEHWLRDGNVSAIETLASALYRLKGKHLDIDDVHIYLLRTHGTLNDTKGALDLKKRIEDYDLDVSEKFNRELVKLLLRCKVEVPKSLNRFI